jgi:hypothetical protein
VGRSSGLGSYKDRSCEDCTVHINTTWI